jgi:hypothetical protein
MLSVQPSPFLWGTTDCDNRDLTESAVLNNWGPRSYNSGGGIDNERGEKTR